MNKTERTETRSLSEFEDDVNLYRLIPGGTGKALVLLRKIADKIHQDNYESPGTKLPSILLCGKEGTRLHARALINSLCLEDIRECDSRFFDNGMNSKELFEASDFNSVHIITNVEQLRPSQEAVIWQFLRMGWCSYHNFARQARELVHCNGMIILTTSDFSKVPKSITSAIDYKIGIEPYNQSQQELIVHQQLKFCGIDYLDDEEILKKIVDFGCNQLELIFDLLKVCILLAQTDNQNILTMSLVKKASKLV